MQRGDPSRVGYGVEGRVLVMRVHHVQLVSPHHCHPCHARDDRLRALVESLIHHTREREGEGEEEREGERERARKRSSERDQPPQQNPRMRKQTTVFVVSGVLERDEVVPERESARQRETEQERERKREREIF